MVMRGISSRPVNHRHPCTTLIHAVRSLHTSQICFFPFFFSLQANEHKNTYCSPYQPPPDALQSRLLFSLSLFFLLFSVVLNLISKSASFLFPSFLLVLVSPRKVPVKVSSGSTPQPSLVAREGVSQFSLSLRGRAKGRI